MKTFIKINGRRLLYILLVSFAFGCTDARRKIDYAPKRIVLKERTQINAALMYIVEVDGKEYLINGSGGIQPLSK